MPSDLSASISTSGKTVAEAGLMIGKMTEASIRVAKVKAVRRCVSDIVERT